MSFHVNICFPPHTGVFSWITINSWLGTWAGTILAGHQTKSEDMTVELQCSGCCQRRRKPGKSWAPQPGPPCVHPTCWRSARRNGLECNGPNTKKSGGQKQITEPYESYRLLLLLSTTKQLMFMRLMASCERYPPASTWMSADKLQPFQECIAMGVSIHDRFLCFLVLPTDHVWIVDTNSSWTS